MPIRAGLLDRRVVILLPFVEPDSSGQAKEHDQELAKVWARVEPLGGREDFGQQQFVATGDARFTIRYRSDVTPLNSIVFEGRTYDIVSVAPDGRREALLIIGKARAEEPTS